MELFFLRPKFEIGDKALETVISAALNHRPLRSLALIEPCFRKSTGLFNGLDTGVRIKW
jgi:hypothetical protein